MPSGTAVAAVDDASDDHTAEQLLEHAANEHYKKKEFDKALELYNEAIQIYPKELTLYLNRAGVFHEKKE